MVKPDHKLVQEDIGTTNAINVWIIGTLAILIPFLIAILFDCDLGLPYVMGILVSGFFLATNTMLTAGLLKSSK